MPRVESPFAPEQFDAVYAELGAYDAVGGSPKAMWLCHAADAASIILEARAERDKWRKCVSEVSIESSCAQKERDAALARVRDLAGNLEVTIARVWELDLEFGPGPLEMHHVCIERIAKLEKDLADAAGDFPIPLPEPGTDMANLLSIPAERIAENERLRVAFDVARADVAGRYWGWHVTEIFEELRAAMEPSDG